MENILENGVVYAKLGELEMKFTPKTLFDLLCYIQDDEENDFYDFYNDKEDDVDDDFDDDSNDVDDDFDDDFDDDLSDNDLNDDDFYEKLMYDLRNSKRIVAFTYDDSINSDNKLNNITYCLGIYENAAETERKFNLSKGCVSKIANTWERLLNSDSNYKGNCQWTTRTNEEVGPIMFCYEKDVHHFLLDDDKKINFLYSYL